MDTYDFIVVGIGSAGCVLANRLSENPKVKVLLLEAGPSQIPPEIENHIEIPALWPTLLGSAVDWGYRSVPQPGLSGRVTYEPRGKLPGGSSNLYVLMHIRGHPSDYDGWAAQGCAGWDYQSVLPYFQKLEDQEDDTGPWIGKGGPMPLLNAGLHNPNPTSAAFIEACRELFYPYTADFNGPHMEGVGWHHVNIRDGKRCSAREAYLFPALARPNVTLSCKLAGYPVVVRGSALCRRRIQSEWDPEDSPGGTSKPSSARARIESPKLLLLSGIGNPVHLAEFNIPVVAALPGVGENFHNHVLTGVIQGTSKPVPPGNLNLSECALFYKSDPAQSGPDIQIAFVHVPFDIIVGQNHPNAVSILPGVVRPTSRGWVRLASGNPLDKPLVNPNYLATEADTAAIGGRGEAGPDHLCHARPSPPGPPPSCCRGRRWRRMSSCASLSGSGRTLTTIRSAPARWAVDDMAVVDPHLRVQGLERLRVADASVMPVVPSGNCNAGILMIAEKCADLLRRAMGL